MLDSGHRKSPVGVADVVADIARGGGVVTVDVDDEWTHGVGAAPDDGLVAFIEHELSGARRAVDCTVSPGSMTVSSCTVAPNLGRVYVGSPSFW
jgi:hypothetical protein